MTDGSTPRFLQGAFEFEGNGLDKPALLDDSLRYVVPAGPLTQPVYFRGGSSTDEMVTVVLFKNGKPMRYFPIAAKGATHMALREDLPAVWADLDMPSGYAYGKSFRTVKTCVGSDFCRYGLATPPLSASRSRSATKAWPARRR